MSSSYNQFSTPAIRKMSHSDIVVGTSKSLILTAPTPPERRVVVVVQNKSSTATIQVIGNANDTVGLLVAPLSSITLDNYNGSLYAFSSSAGTSVHIAISAV